MSREAGGKARNPNFRQLFSPLKGKPVGKLGAQESVEVKKEVTIATPSQTADYRAMIERMDVVIERQEEIAEYVSQVHVDMTMRMHQMEGMLEAIMNQLGITKP